MSYSGDSVWEIGKGRKGKIKTAVCPLALPPCQLGVHEAAEGRTPSSGGSTRQRHVSQRPDIRGEPTAGPHVWLCHEQRWLFPSALLFLVALAFMLPPFSCWAGSALPGSFFPTSLRPNPRPRLPPDESFVFWFLPASALQTECLLHLGCCANEIFASFSCLARICTCLCS